MMVWFAKIQLIYPINYTEFTRFPVTLIVFAVGNPFFRAPFPHSLPQPQPIHPKPGKFNSTTVNLLPGYSIFDFQTEQTLSAELRMSKSADRQ